MPCIIASSSHGIECLTLWCAAINLSPHIIASYIVSTFLKLLHVYFSSLTFVVILQDNYTLQLGIHYIRIYPYCLAGMPSASFMPKIWGNIERFIRSVPSFYKTHNSPHMLSRVSHSLSLSLHQRLGPNNLWWQDTQTQTHNGGMTRASTGSCYCFNVTVVTRLAFGLVIRDVANGSVDTVATKVGGNMNFWHDSCCVQWALGGDMGWLCTAILFCISWCRVTTY